MNPISLPNVTDYVPINKRGTVPIFFITTPYSSSIETKHLYELEFVVDATLKVNCYMNNPREYF